MKPILYIMCGLPFSGKTVLAKKILEQVPLEYISIDEIKFARGPTWTEDEQLSAEEWQSIFDESYQKTTDALKNDRSVLYDSANQSRVSRDKLREVATTAGAKAKVIFINTPEDVVEERWREKHQTKERFHLPERFFRAAFSNYEPPTEDENVIEYKAEQWTEVWIKQTFKQDDGI